MIKFHITEEGPKDCEANVRDCPIGGEHFTDLDEALVAYGKLKDADLLPKTGKPKFKMFLTAPTQKVADMLTSAGYRPLIVGGSVRDAFLGKLSKDVDFEVFGTNPDGSGLSLSELREVLPRKEGFKIDEAGATFSVLKVRYLGEDFDIALPRTEQSTGDGHKSYDTQHNSTMSYDEASSRRDFTINAMAYDPASKRLIDPHNGRSDLKRGILRHVGPAFADDPLRALRAVNFASRFNLTVADETKGLCRSLAPTASSLSHERVEEEFNKLFMKGTHCERGLEVLHEIGWSEQFDGFKNCSRDELAAWGKQLNDVKPGRLRKALLSHQLDAHGKGDVRKLLESGTKERKFLYTFTKLVDASKDSSHGELIAIRREVMKGSLGTSLSDIYETAGKAGADEKRLRALPTPVETAVTGKWLIEKGYEPGKGMGEMIKVAQQIQDQEGINDPDELLKRVS